LESIPILGIFVYNVSYFHCLDLFLFQNIYILKYSLGVWEIFFANWKKNAKFCEGKPPYIGGISKQKKKSLDNQIAVPQDNNLTSP
jgi:hypothetical protein